MSPTSSVLAIATAMSIAGHRSADGAGVVGTGTPTRFTRQALTGALTRTRRTRRQRWPDADHHAVPGQPADRSGPAVSALATARARRRKSRDASRPRRSLRRRHLQLAILVACVTRLLVAQAAHADVVMYSWSGRVQAVGANPWNLLENGTPFRARALVAPDAVDLDGALNPDFARFRPILLLSIGGELTPVTNPEITFSDDDFGTLDSITLHTSATRLGTTLSMSSNMRIPITSFALSDAPAPDLPPIFADTTPVQLGGAGTQSLLTFPDNATVTGRLQICGESPTPVSWTSTSTGSAGEIEVALANLGEPVLNPANYELQGPDFAAGPLCSTTPQIDYATGSDWSATLSAPVGALRVYAKFWRGTAGGVDPVTYQFDAPFTIESGFAQASVGNGNTLLMLPTSTFHDGILRFDGPIASLSVETNSTSNSQQAMTLAVPEPDAAAGVVAAMACLVAMARRARCLQPKIDKLRRST